MRARFAFLPLLLAVTGLPATAQQPPPAPLPPGYVEEPEVAPEDPLPPPPREFPILPDVPLIAAPDAVEVMKACPYPTFTDCFRLWQPPPPLPEPEKDTASAPHRPPPFDPKAPRDPALGGPVPPPPFDPEKAAASAAADKATYDALAKALKDSGLDGKVLLTNPPADGATLKLDRNPNKLPPKAQPQTPTTQMRSRP